MSSARAALAVALMGAACSGAPTAPETGSPLPASAPADAAVALADGAGAAAPHLGPLHPGWKRAKCLACHDEQALPGFHEGAAHVPPTCVSCHGYNGAPHVDHAADPLGQCAECHSTGAVVSDHLADYLLPQDCATCHVHPANRGGL